MASQVNKTFWSEFIELYKNCPELWNAKCASYKNKVLKTAAYESLAEKLREIDPCASVETVKKKINSLRCCFRRELKKIQDRELCGIGEDDALMPSLWYFEDLEFLRDDYVVPKMKQSIKRRSTPSPPPRRNESADNTSYKQLKHGHDEADILGLSWSYQYRDLTRDQKLYAKKAIDDILFEARLGTLHRNSVRINETACSTCGSAQYIELPIDTNPFND